MQADTEYCFRITIIEASDISEQYSDVFCQFKSVFLSNLIFNYFDFSKIAIHFTKSLHLLNFLK